MSITNRKKPSIKIIIHSRRPSANQTQKSSKLSTLEIDRKRENKLEGGNPTYLFF